MKTVYGALVVVGLVIGLCSVVQAQGYVERDFRDDEVVDDTLLRAGRFELLLHTSGMLSTTYITTIPLAEEDDGTGGTTETDEEPTEPEGISSSQLTRHVNILIDFGYMVTDEFEVRIEGLVRNIHVEVGDVVFQNLWAWGGGLQALYHVNLMFGVAGYVGLGGGFFYGDTERPFQGIEGQEGTDDEDLTQDLEVSIPTYVGVGQLFAGLLMQPGPRWTMRGGLRFETLFGFERPNDERLGYDEQDWIDLVVMAELAMGVRF